MKNNVFLRYDYAPIVTYPMLSKKFTILEKYTFWFYDNIGMDVAPTFQKKIMWLFMLTNNSDKISWTHIFK